jgi:hypothetical protein
LKYLRTIASLTTATRHADGREVAWTNPVLLDEDLLAGLRGVTRYGQAVRTRAAAGHQPAHGDGRGFDTGQRLRALQDALIERRQLVHLIAAEVGINRRPDGVLFKAERQRREVAEASQEQPGAYGQRERQRHLRDDEHL